MPDDNISVGLVRKLWKCQGPDAPFHFLLDFEQCNSLEALEYVGEVLQINSTISWLEIIFRQQPMTVDSMANLFQFVSHLPTLKVLEVSLGSNGNRAPSMLVDEMMRLFLMAAAQNGNIETVKLSGRPCHFVTEFFKFIGATSNIQELELIDFPDSVVKAWPPNTSISKLRLKPSKSERRNIFSPDGHPGLTSILDLLAESSSRGASIKHLHIEQWSWSLSKYLQSCNSSVECLHLAQVDFRHDRITGLSPINVFLIGIQGSKTTTELCLESCLLDKKSADQILQGLKDDTLGLKVLKFKDMNLENELIEQLFEECECLERLEFDGPFDIIDKCIDGVNDGLGSCVLSSLAALKFPATSLSAVGPSLKIAATTHSLTSLEVTNTTLEVEDVEFLTGLLADERCQLHHLSLEYLSGFDPKIVLAMEGEKSKIESLRLADVTGESLAAIVGALVGSLAAIKKMNHLTIVCPDLSPKMEEELGVALSGNWSLLGLTFERLVPSEGTAGKMHKSEPVISRAFARKLEEILERNRAKKRASLSTASPSSVADGPGMLTNGALTELEIS